MRLYLEDVRDLHSLLCQVSPEVSIKTHSHQFDSVEELAATQPPTIRELNLAVSKPHVSLTLSAQSARIYILDDTPSQRGVLEQLKSRLLHCKQTLGWTATPKGSLLGLGLVLVPPNLVIAGITQKIGHSWFLLGGLSAIGVAILLYGARVNFKAYSIIHLATRSERPDFFARNKDKILLAVVSAAIGAAMSIGITALVRALDNP